MLQEIVLRSVLLHALQAQPRFLNNSGVPATLVSWEVPPTGESAAPEVVFPQEVVLLETQAALEAVTSSAADVAIEAFPAPRFGHWQGVGRHPCWDFPWSVLHNFQVTHCSVLLLFAGMLCSAGGIGGGAVFVMLLLVFGGLDVSDAVPLSKAIIFVGSFSSLPLTLRRAALPDPRQATLVDFDICRLVVPAALTGTYVGVLLNRLVPDWGILLLLTLVLTGMSSSVLQTTWRQYSEECDELMLPTTHHGTGSLPTSFFARPVRAIVSSPVLCSQGFSEAEPAQELTTHKVRMQHRLMPKDTIAAVLMLLAVVGCGVLRAHAGACLRASAQTRSEVCRHPVLFFLGDALEAWMQPHSASAKLVSALALAFPLACCLSVLFFYSHWLMKHEDWSRARVAQFAAMAVAAGCLAGLVGIGGGLIFAPFFLGLGLEPSTAVATSSLCVVFTSASTALQFLLTDRIIMPMLLVYGTVNMVAFNLGTCFVHFLREHFTSRRSFISGIVALGVLLSTVMSVAKLLSEIGEQKTFPAAATAQ